MGYLTYAGSSVHEVEDRLLAHARAVVTAKLRRSESFMLSWPLDAARGSGRVSLWISPFIPVTFTFSGSRVPPLSNPWLEVLGDLANSARGLVLVSEQEAQRLAAGQERSR